MKKVVKNTKNNGMLRKYAIFSAQITGEYGKMYAAEGRTRKAQDAAVKKTAADLFFGVRAVFSARPKKRPTGSAGQSCAFLHGMVFISLLLPHRE